MLTNKRKPRGVRSMLDLLLCIVVLARLAGQSIAAM